LCDVNTPDENLAARAALFADEGYTVLALGGTFDTGAVRTAAKTLTSQAEATGEPVCVVHGDGAVAMIGAASEFAAIVAFDAPGLTAQADMLAALPCPVVLQFGTKNTPAAATAADALRTKINPANGSRVYAWPDAAPGFAFPGDPRFDSRLDSLAHTRTLEPIRRIVGPHYDYEALFAEHIRHEFETRDVDATMATMIEDPYVNHVATLAGGVGHDMLKRFYKYHFVEQNSRERFSTTVSVTPGPDRVAIELVVRFRHDQMLDRYFPGIAPTGKMVELATLLIVKFRGDKLCHEHIYWDQGSALKQIGVLETGDLPVAGPEAARKVLDEHLPSNIFMQDAWATSEDKPI
jgi:carboxymethylenebutenolidase